MIAVGVSDIQASDKNTDTQHPLFGMCVRCHSSTAENVPDPAFFGRGVEPDNRFSGTGIRSLTSMPCVSLAVTATTRNLAIDNWELADL
jgi:hypothetical protein